MNLVDIDYLKIVSVTVVMVERLVLTVLCKTPSTSRM